jgi:hypothetical protein
MKERPILLSGAMVRVLLDGRKTQTRRVAKLPRTHTGNCMPCPYGDVGDRLWVRESLKFVDTPTTRHDHTVYAADGVRVLRDPRLVDWACDGMAFGFANSMPSIHMPRWASRITLEVTGVRVERLKDIREADARAEGVTIEDRHMNGYCAGAHWPPSIRAFAELWDGLNAARGYGWDANPWVWVVEFDKC